MNIKKAALFLTLLSAVISLSILPLRSNTPQKPIIPQPINVSMIQLIATPERFDGKMVSVVGYLGIESEDARLYVSEEDYRRYIPENGVFIDVNKEMERNIEKIDIHYVILAGVFRQKGAPVSVGSNSEITDIRRCTPLLELTDKRPRHPKEGQPEKPR
jgi:hypothetical protein